MELSALSASDPRSDHYILPPGKTARDLVRLLMARQKTWYGVTIVERGDISYTILVKNMKRLMALYSLDQIKRGIELSVRNGQHPASTKFVEEQIACLNAKPYLSLTISAPK